MPSLGSNSFPCLATRTCPFFVFILLCASCVSPGNDLAVLESAEPIEAHEPSSVDSLDWGPFGDLSHLELSFMDTDADAVIYVTGPYELVYWDEEQIDLIGNLYPDTGAARLTLMQRGDEVWAHLRIPDAEYLTRVE